MVLVIFPEGARSIDGRVREFRRGAGILARQVKVPMVPAGIWGAHAVWPREGRKQRHPMAVAFGEPVPPSQGKTEAELVEALRDAVVNLVDSASRE
jgi:1-acyl-sn-glycerol-3-phosphate acyltransferase